jgi:hypothetical protein
MVYVCRDPGCPWFERARQAEVSDAPPVNIGQGLLIAAVVRCECGAEPSVSVTTP